MGNGCARRIVSRGVRRLLVAGLTAGIVAVAPGGAATDAATVDPSSTLIDEVGPGWTLVDAGTPGQLGLTTRRFTNEHGALQVSFVPMPPSIDPRIFLTQLATVTVDLPPVEGLGIPDSLAFGGGDPAGEQVHAAFVAAETGAIVVVLHTQEGADWQPVELLRSVAAAQLERAGGSVAR